MRVLVGGGRGFIGSHLVAALDQRGDEAVVISRDPKNGEVGWDEITPALLSTVDAVINLAGCNIAAHNWTPRYKTEILTSRLHTTAAIVQAITDCASPPRFFLNASAIGYYSLEGDAVFDEESPPGTHFLAQVCQEWESAAQLVNGKIRRAIVRFGLVLGSDGGAYQRLTTLFRWYLGGRIGTGEQPVCWIHIDDLVGLMLYLLDSEECSGIYNGVAPNWATNQEFTHLLAESLDRPALFNAPAWLLHIAMSERAEQLLLKGARVVPRRTQESGFQWKFPTLESALQQLSESTCRN
jgi:uncharacterized protein